MAGETQVPPGTPAKLADADPFGAQPPRTFVAVNAKTDASNDANWGDNKDADTPVSDKIDDPFTPAAVISIVSHVAKRLDLPLDEAWTAQKGPATKWHVDDKEDAWARKISEITFGMAYMGPDAAYAMGSTGETNPWFLENWLNYIYSRFQKKVRRTYLQKKQGTKTAQTGAYDLQSWKNPTCFKTTDGTTPAPEMHDNEDPAVPIVCACQHLVTYGFLSRGFTLDDLNGVGFSASDAVSGYRIFPSAKAAPPPAGTIDPPDGAPAPAPPGSWVPADAAVLDVNLITAKVPTFGPGTVFVYDPDGGSKSVTIFLSDYEYQYRQDKCLLELFKTRSADGKNDFKLDQWDASRTQAPSYADELAAEKKRLEERINREKALADKQGLSQQQRDLMTAQTDKLKASLETRIEAEKDHSTKSRTISLTKQLIGSHITMVMRVNPGKDRMQLLNTGRCRPKNEKLNEDGLDFAVSQIDEYLGDTYGITRVPTSDGKSYIGMGVAPAPPDLDGQTQFIAKARPIGLARLVLTVRQATADSTTSADVIFVSRLLRTYGSDPSQNYYVSRLLWSLRNTPGFTNIQPWWYVFVPMGLLAKAMWAEDKPRSMTLADFVDQFARSTEKRYWNYFDTSESSAEMTARQAAEKSMPPAQRPRDQALQRQLAARGRLVYGKHYLPTVVMSNDGGTERSKAGKAYFACRWRDNGSGQLKIDMKDPPGAIKKILQTLDWNDVYLHEKLKGQLDAIEKGMPPFFANPRAAAPAPSGPLASVDADQEARDLAYDDLDLDPGAPDAPSYSANA